MHLKDFTKYLRDKCSVFKHFFNSSPHLSFRVLLISLVVSLISCSILSSYKNFFFIVFFSWFLTRFMLYFFSSTFIVFDFLIENFKNETKKFTSKFRNCWLTHTQTYIWWIRWSKLSRIGNKNRNRNNNKTFGTKS